VQAQGRKEGAVDRIREECGPRERSRRQPRTASRGLVQQSAGDPRHAFFARRDRRRESMAPIAAPISVPSAIARRDPPARMRAPSISAPAASSPDRPCHRRRLPGPGRRSGRAYPPAMALPSGQGWPWRRWPGSAIARGLALRRHGDRHRPVHTTRGVGGTRDIVLDCRRVSEVTMLHRRSMAAALVALELDRPAVLVLTSWASTDTSCVTASCRRGDSRGRCWAARRRAGR